MSLFILFLGAIFVNNFIFSKFLGICPFLGVSKKVETAARYGCSSYIRYNSCKCCNMGCI